MNDGPKFLYIAFSETGFFLLLLYIKKPDFDIAQKEKVSH
jgi:hypothetical protein